MSDSNYDNRLEQLSQRAADGYTPPGNASWDKMEAALDIVMPVQEKKRRRFIFWWLFPLALIGAGIIYTAWPDNTVVSSLPTVTKQNSITEPEAKNMPQKEKQSDAPHSPIILPETEKSNAISINTPTASSVRHTQKSANSYSTIKNINLTSQQKDASTQSVVTSVIRDTSAITNAVSTQIPANTVYSIQPTIDSGSKMALTGIIEKTDTAVISLPIQTDTLQTENNNISKAKKAAESKFSFAFVAGLDASTVKFKHTDNTGINAGIVAGYHFNESWSVHTGILYTKKNYTVSGEDFHAPKNSWVANYKLTMVDGFCNMWEVPLFVRYQFNPNSKRSFFLSSGISSYIMTRENYNYSYYYNGQPVTRNSNYPNGNTHLLSILRLSGGWRKTIGPGTSVLVEPYASLPLTGLGFGNIRLSSFGLNFSLQIRQPSEKK
jgi:hypothetical protein